MCAETNPFNLRVRNNISSLLGRRHISLARNCVGTTVYHSQAKVGI